VLVKCLVAFCRHLTPLKDIVAFADAHPALSPKALLKELASTDGSILRYFVDRAEDVLKDEMLREAFVAATPNKKVVLKLSDRVNASGRGIGINFANGECEVLQQSGKELGSGEEVRAMSVLTAACRQGICRRHAQGSAGQAWRQRTSAGYSQGAA
jgi:hypothetical protein